PGHSLCYPKIVYNGILYFAAQNQSDNIELWRTDGTEVGTFMVKDISVDDSEPDDFVMCNGILYFRAMNQSTKSAAYDNNELWRSDGTESGTYLVKEIYFGDRGGYPNELTVYNDIVYFIAADGLNGYELWRSDGTDVGTYIVKDLYPGTGLGASGGLIVYNDLLFFRGGNSTIGLELYKTNGTEEGTELVIDLNTGGHSWPDNLIEMGGLLYFTANDGSIGEEFWRTDGNFVLKVKDLNPGPGNSLFAEPTILNGLLYFKANNTLGLELWRSNGNQFGTYVLKDINVGNASSSPTLFTPCNEYLYFRANDGIHDYELWRTDGTSLGTVLYKDINPSGSGYPDELASFNGILYFAADDGSGVGEELWIC
ncbi:MAG: hypothetical protein ACFFG0_50330, partial [Candidatus Thorarchaeota archaeon]